MDSINMLLIILIGVVSFYAWSNPVMYSKWVMNPYEITKKKEYHRFFTSGFIHANYFHLFINLLTMFYFGQVVESIFSMLFGHQIGALLYLLLFVLGVVLSDLPTYLKYRNSSWYTSVGASGGISALVFSAIMFNPLAEICLYFFICLPGFIMGILYLIYSYYQDKNSDQGVNHSAHFYGAVVGVVFSIIIKPEVVPYFFTQIAQWLPFK